MPLKPTFLLLLSIQSYYTLHYLFYLLEKIGINSYSHLIPNHSLLLPLSSNFTSTPFSRFSHTPLFNFIFFFNFLNSLLEIESKKNKKEMRCGIVLLVLLAFSLHEANISLAKGTVEMVPLVGQGTAEMVVPMLSGNRRKLNSFQICAMCTCCGGGNKNYCLPSPCCYAINCNIPNRPFGFCSFTPKTCNCFGCHI